MFDDEELIEDTRVDINQTNNAQSASAVDSNRIEVTRVAGVANQDPHAIDAIESSRTCFANEIKRKLIFLVFQNINLPFQLIRL